MVTKFKNISTFLFLLIFSAFPFQKQYVKAECTSYSCRWSNTIGACATYGLGPYCIYVDDQFGSYCPECLIIIGD